MSGLVNDHDRIGRRNRIEFLPVRRALLLELRLVIAEAQDEVHLLHEVGIGGGPVPQVLLDLRDVAVRSVGRRQHVGARRLQAAHRDMAVRIDETRQQGAAAEIDDRGAGALQLHDITGRADGKDAAVLTATASARGLASSMVRIGPPE